MEKCGLFCPTSLPSFQSSSFPTFLPFFPPPNLPIFPPLSFQPSNLPASSLPFFLSSSRLSHPHSRFVAGAAVKGEVREEICQT